MTSGGMILPSFVKIGSGVQKLLGENKYIDTERAKASHKPTFIF
jgi:hypothetical protein